MLSNGTETKSICWFYRIGIKIINDLTLNEYLVILSNLDTHVFFIGLHRYVYIVYRQPCGKMIYKEKHIDVG